MAGGHSLHRQWVWAPHTQRCSLGKAGAPYGPSAASGHRAQAGAGGTRGTGGTSVSPTEPVWVTAHRSIHTAYVTNTHTAYYSTHSVRTPCIVHTAYAHHSRVQRKTCSCSTVPTSQLKRKYTAPQANHVPQHLTAGYKQQHHTSEAACHPRNRPRSPREKRCRSSG